MAHLFLDGKCSDLIKDVEQLEMMTEMAALDAPVQELAMQLVRPSCSIPAFLNIDPCWKSYCNLMLFLIDMSWLLDVERLTT